MIRQAVNLLLKQNEWARVIRDYMRDVFEARGIPWKKPVGANVVDNTLVVVFPDGEQWSLMIKSEKL
jgi:hypothetical protein